jgi:hypothetical protein
MISNVACKIELERDVKQRKEVFFDVVGASRISATIEVISRRSSVYRCRIGARSVPAVRASSIAIAS